MGILSSFENICVVQRNYKFTTTSRLLMLYGFSLLLVSDLVLPVDPREKSSSKDKNETGICSKAVDIRNTLDAFEGLRGCRVVEGFVQILLVDSINETALSNISFPELTEITDYLLMFRVNGLRSLGQLFPNLAVIRGQNLFYGYGLVIFEMSSLQEIALYSLTNITRGLIRIDKNPSLCFVNSIDWDQIATEKGDHFIKSIKPENECPLCPEEVTFIDSATGILKHNKCPRTRKHNFDDSNNDRFLCWNKKHCQRKCPENCQTCNMKGECCSSKCLGGCTEDINNCTVCKNFSVFDGTKYVCQDSCPKGLYEYLGRRCVSSEKCQSIKKPINVRPASKEEFYKIYNNSCVLDCPANFTSNNKQECVPCNGTCKKHCNGLNVDRIKLAKQLRGCTHIIGGLEIQIRGGRNVVSELEENLSMIEEISGYLKIVRSFPLVSLHFFKRLRRIKGEQLDNQKYAFVVLDNQNLQDLWDWTDRNFTIDRGRLFFHFNPKLCLKIIQAVEDHAHLTPHFTEMEVAKNSNGDKVACELKDMDLNVRCFSTAMQLTWDRFEPVDQRTLLGYIVYSIEAPYQNVTLYDGRDACGGDGWRMDDVAPQDSSRITHPLTLLQPYTQYAFYVKTYTIATEKIGAQSKIHYARTKPSVPSSPQNLHLLSSASDHLEFEWKPPLHPNGNVTHYIVTGKRHLNDPLVNERDYCENPPEITPPATHISTRINITNTTETCQCYEQKSTNIIINEGEQQSRIDFENTLQNEVYYKRNDNAIRKKRENLLSRTFPVDADTELDSNGELLNQMDYGRRYVRESTDISEEEEQSRIDFENTLQNELYYKKPMSNSRKKRENSLTRKFPASTEKQPNLGNNEIQNKTENGLYDSFSFTVYTTKIKIDKLYHYTYYDVSVRACRELDEDEVGLENTTEIRCSAKSIKTEHTQVKENADQISSITLKNQTSDSITITWEEPKEPNGIIFAYDIEYRRTDIENSKAILMCITRESFHKQNKLYQIKLSPGNYSIRVRAFSSAKNGRYSPDYSPTLVVMMVAPQRIPIILGAIFTTILLSVVGIVIFCYMKNKRDKKNMRLIPSVNPEYVHTVYVADEWEIPRENISYTPEDALGQGSFGMVYAGIARDIRGQAEVRCAIKTVNEHATDRERIEFLNEASVMKAFDTSHVVRLLGVVSKGQPTLVIMELMANGDLKSYLRSHRPDAENPSPRQPPSLRQILQMAIEIADGMAYLAAKKFVHRDLAARNCMVSEDLTVKIGDFGMTRDIYETDYYRKGTKGLLPVRWMAPESLQDGVFTSSSDVWSYGVVLWEMATLGSQPYQGLSNDQVLRYVIAGGLMERPENCPDILYNLMTWCWQHKPSHRPTFLKLCSELVDDANPNFAQVSFYHSPAGIEAQHLLPTPSPSQDDANTPLRADSEGNSSFSNSEDSDVDIHINPHNRHRKFRSKAPVSTTANGFVGCPTNGAATTQC